MNKKTEEIHLLREFISIVRDILRSEEFREMKKYKHHMFSLTPMPPTTIAGWLICFYDKVAAISDRFGENKWEITSFNFEKSEKELVYNNS